MNDSDQVTGWEVLQAAAGAAIALALAVSQYRAWRAARCFHDGGGDGDGEPLPAPDTDVPPADDVAVELAS